MDSYPELEAAFAMESFEKGGRELWQGLRRSQDPQDVVALVVEACRVKDRLDRLHRLQERDSEEWGRLIPTDIAGEFVLKVGGVLRELRQSEIVFKQLLSEIDRRRSAYVDDAGDEEGGLSDL